MKKIPVFLNNPNGGYERFIVTIDWLQNELKIPVTLMEYYDLKLGNGKEAFYLVPSEMVMEFSMFNNTRFNNLKNYYSDIIIIIIHFGFYGWGINKILNDHHIIQIICDVNYKIPSCEINDMAKCNINRIFVNIKNKLWGSIKLILIGHKIKGNVFNKLPNDMINELILFIMKS